jgi:Protein of unknown function (DUF2975)
MKKGTTLILRMAVILIGIPVLVLGVMGIIVYAKEGPFNPEYAWSLYPVFIGMYISAIPFYIALYQAFKLLNIIDRNQAFSELSVHALKRIKYCAYVISAIYVVVMPFFFFIAEYDDAPGIILINWILVFASLVIGFFAAILQNLLNEAIVIKSENEFTV